MKVKLTDEQATETYWALSNRLEMWKEKRDEATDDFYRNLAQLQVDYCANAMWAIDEARSPK